MSTYATRSSHGSTLLSIPGTRTRTADNAFQVAGPSQWNSLPSNMRQAKSVDIFKGQLKTHLFNYFFAYVLLVYSLFCSLFVIAFILFFFFFFLSFSAVMSAGALYKCGVV